MQQLHEKLSGGMSWYGDWHKNPLHSLVHFLVFLVITLTIGSFLLANINDFSRSQDSLAALGSLQSDVVTTNIGVVNDQLIKQLKKFETSPVGDGQQNSEKLTTLLTSRKNKLLEKMAKGDKGIESQFLPDEIRQRIPEDMDSLVEKSVSLQGTISVAYIDGIKDEDSYVEYTLEANNEAGEKTNYQVYFEKGKEPYLKHGLKVNVKGMELDNRIFVAADSGQSSLTTSSATAMADVAGTKSLLVVLVNFADNPSQPFTRNDVYNSVFVNPDSTDALIKEGSFNKVSLTGMATDWLTINSPSNVSCDFNTWGSLADQAAIAAGYNVSSYNYVMYMLNGVSLSVCNWGGVSYVGGNRTWINGIYAAHGTKAHELGHNFGVWHSGFYTCGSQQVGSSCGFDQYGEYIAKMGSRNNSQFNALHRFYFGWIPANQVKTVSSSGTYTIYSDYSSNTTEPKILKLTKPDTGETYYVTFKQAVGFNAGIPAGDTKGATIYIWNGVHTEMLTMTPGSDYTNVALWDGGSFNDSANNITITQLSHTVDTVTLSIALATPPCTPANPVVSISPSSQTSKAGGSLTYTVSVINKNGSNCSSSVYSIIPNLGPGFSSPQTSLTLASGATGSVNVSVLSTQSLTDGSYPFTVTVSDTNNNGFSANASATYVVYTPVTDTVPPNVSISFPTNGVKVSGTVNVSATATDNVGVTKVLFYIDGSRVTTDSMSPYSYRWSISKHTRVGKHTITAKAYDAANNASSTSITVYK